MGPTVLFDKSFLQSLSVDESVWFDYFFVPNICPIFFVETLADLEKAVREGKTPEGEVGLIATKAPTLSSMPCTFHQSLCMASLFGHPVPFTGQIPASNGRPVNVDGEHGVVFEETPEAKAFSRWQNREFMEVERSFARGWRAALNSIDLEAVARGFRELGITGKNCRSLEEAYAIADSIVSGSDKPYERMKIAISSLAIPIGYMPKIRERWALSGNPSLSRFAPYAAHVAKVELFFQIALAANLISAGRASNRTDIAYLYYLPFCQVFVSSDLLHEKCAKLFLRHDQSFAWGPDLKASLKATNEHFSLLPDDTKAKGIFAFATAPLGDETDLLSQLWDTYLPGWRGRKKIDTSAISPEANAKLVEKFKRFDRAPTSELPLAVAQGEAPESLTIKRSVKATKGSWTIIAKDVADRARTQQRQDDSS